MSKTPGEIYDEEFFTGKQSSSDKLGFYNVGYWKGIPETIEYAQVNLIETLTSFFSANSANVLDVACGKGASSKFLTKLFNPKSITGINITERQLEVCRVIAPDCHFKLMNAEKLEFENAMFDNVLCIESGFNFLIRYRFFHEAYRVLKQGGRLAMSDLISSKHQTDEYYIPNVDAYQESLLKAGFRYVRVEDSTDLQSKAWLNHEVKRLEREFHKRQDPKILDEITQLIPVWTATKSYMVYAIK